MTFEEIEKELQVLDSENKYLSFDNDYDDRRIMFNEALRKMSHEFMSNSNFKSIEAYLNVFVNSEVLHCFKFVYAKNGKIKKVLCEDAYEYSELTDEIIATEYSKIVDFVKKLYPAIEELRTKTLIEEINSL